MSTFKKLIYNASSFFAMQFLQKLSPVNTLFPYHHTVSDEALPHIQHLYSYKNVAQFSKDLDALLKYNTPVTPQELSECLQTKKPFPKKSFLLSFDDGFKETHDIIAPILQQKGVPAIFFITPAFIDNKKLFIRNKTSLLIHELINSKNKDLLKIYNQHLNIAHASINSTIKTLKGIKRNDSTILDELAIKTGFCFDDYLKEKQPFLSTDQVLSLHKKGFSIGGHSMTHPYYEQLTLAEQIEQTINSCRYVQELTGNTNEYFSFPFSEKYLPQDLFDELNKTSIKLLFGLQNQKEEEGNKTLHRFNAERPAVEMENQLKAILLVSYLRKISGKQKVLRAKSG
jgi:peptidoglycan/xylan/chitin deacetylase (PgdA/CDA1 family)